MLHGSDNATAQLRNAADLARAIGIDPSRARRWMRLGLLLPERFVRGRGHFNLRQLQIARLIAQLSRRGHSPKQIKRQLDRLRKPRCKTSTQVPVVSFGSILSTRDDDGSLRDWSGQRMFDFERDETCSTVPFCELASVDELFHRALDLEDEGHLEQSASVYKTAIERAPWDASLYFNLGNVLFALNDPRGAATCYEQALQIDPSNADAWNNLGSALMEAAE